MRDVLRVDNKCRDVFDTSEHVSTFFIYEWIVLWKISPIVDYTAVNAPIIPG